MFFQKHIVFSACLLLLLATKTAQAQDTQLSDAQTMEDVVVYVRQEVGKIPQNVSRTESSLMFADVLMSANEKLLKIAGNDKEKETAYRMRLQALHFLTMADVEGAEQKLNAFLNELETSEHAYLRGLAALYRFDIFYDRVMSETVTPDNLAQAKSELNTWFAPTDVPASNVVTLGLQIAERYKIPIKLFVEELVEYVQSPECRLTAERKKEVLFALEVALCLTVGHDPKLYGKTLDDKDFKWESLRGKYVLINFTATWCGPCQREIPALREAYSKFHDKGFEIVSVYIGERGEPSEQIEVVRKSVERNKLPWIILSEALTEKAKQPKQGEFYYVPGVPMMVLVDEEGKVIATGLRAENGALQTKLKEVFK